MESLNDETLYEPFGTSLRMSDLGYSSKTQAQLDISLNNLDDYISDPAHALRCGSRLVIDGMYESEVKAICGEPISERRLGYVLRSHIDRRHGLSKTRYYGYGGFLP